MIASLRATMTHCSTCAASLQGRASSPHRSSRIDRQEIKQPELMRRHRDGRKYLCRWGEPQVEILYRLARDSSGSQLATHGCAPTHAHIFQFDDEALSHPCASPGRPDAHSPPSSATHLSIITCKSGCSPRRIRPLPFVERKNPPLCPSSTWDVMRRHGTVALARVAWLSPLRQVRCIFIIHSTVSRITGEAGWRMYLAECQIELAAMEFRVLTEVLGRLVCSVSGRST